MIFLIVTTLSHSGINIQYTVRIYCRKIYNLFVRALETGRKASL
jgi:hypothetical protein